MSIAILCMLLPAVSAWSGILLMSETENQIWSPTGVWSNVHFPGMIMTGGGGAVTLNGKVYMAGGDRQSDYESFYVLDLTTNVTVAGPNLDGCATGNTTCSRRSVQVSIYNGQFMVCGGVGYPGLLPPSAQCIYYEEASSKWISLNVPVGSSGLGGQGDVELLYNEYTGKNFALMSAPALATNNAMFELNMASLRWDLIAARSGPTGIPYGRSVDNVAAAVISASETLVCGGSSTASGQINHAYDDCFIFSTANRYLWTRTYSMQKRRANAVMAVYQGSAYVLGGWADDLQTGDTPYDYSVEKFDRNLGWSIMPTSLTLTTTASSASHRFAVVNEDHTL